MISEQQQGSKRVNFIIGRFQPIHKGHIKIAQRLNEINDLPVVLVMVRGKKSEKSPLSEELTRSILESTTQISFIEDVVKSASGFFFEIVSSLRKNDYEPVLWGAGEDRAPSYQDQVRKLKDEIEPALPDDLGVYTVDRGDNISATRIRDAIIQNDQNSFEQMTPFQIHPFFDSLKLQLS